MQDLFNTSGAIFSEPDQKHRFVLWRIWDESKPPVAIIGLNPSTADVSKNDNTITRCIDFAHKWGHGGLYMLNLWSFRATHPKDLKKYFKENTKAIITQHNEENHKYVVEYCHKATKIVFAWGANKRLNNYMDREFEVVKQFPYAYCLKFTRGGCPQHPLFVGGDTELIDFKNHQFIK